METVWVAWVFSGGGGCFGWVFLRGFCLVLGFYFLLFQLFLSVSKAVNRCLLSKSVGKEESTMVYQFLECNFRLPFLL